MNDAYMNTKRPLTVGIDIRLIGQGRTGDEVVFFQLVRELIRRRDPNIRYQLFTAERDTDRLAALRLKLEALGRADIEIVPLTARNRFVWNGLILPWRLFRHPVDVFHTQYILPLFLPRRLKVVTHIHDVSFRVHPEWIGVLDRFFLSLFMPRTFTRSDRLIVPSEFTRSEMLAHWNIAAERIIVIENAAAEEWFQPQHLAETEAVLVQYGLTRGQYFISSGTLQPRKNIPFLIAAFTRAVEEKGMMFPLVLTGNPAGHNVDQRLRDTRTHTKTKIIYTGYVSDTELRALVGGARAYIFPSLYEGFGIPIEEAIALGTPVLASDIPVFREVGRDRVHYFDPCALAPLVDTLYTFSIGLGGAEPRGKDPLPPEQRSYTWPKSAAKLAQLYLALTEPSR